MTITAERETTRVAIIGAGVSGLAAARALDAAGCDVVIFEKAADIGGVWSASRAYPGISTQDDRVSYTYSDLAMPEDAATHPTGAQVRSYLETYAERHGLLRRIRFSTKVAQTRSIGGGWEVDSVGPDGRATESFDWLIAANGVFSTSHVPAWAGRTDFEAAGGRIVLPGALGDGAALDGRRTVVVGWGKTACDIAAVAATRSVHTDVVARTLTWKYPKRLGLGGLTFHHIVLTRAGERLIGTAYRTPEGRLLKRRIPERIPRLMIDRLLARAVDRSLGLSELGLRSTFEFRASTSLVTDGFLEAVRDGRMSVHREVSVESLGADADGPLVRLSDGTVVRAEVVVAATGYDRDVSFLDADSVARAADEDGFLLLHRKVLAAGVPNLAFVGWIQNYRSPLNAEVHALWLAGLVLGVVPRPGADWRQAAARIPLGRAAAARAHGAPLPSMSLAELDRMLAEAGVRLPLRTRLHQIWRPLDPSEYAGLLPRVLAAGGVLRPRRREAVRS